MIKDANVAKHREYANKNLNITHSGLCLISLEKVIECKEYGLCVSKEHARYNEQNAKKYNTQLMKLFCYLTQRSWNEIDSIRRDREYGHERLPIKCVHINHVKEHFKKLGKDNCDIFRFGAQNFRACGYREKNIFYLICIDYDFSLYNHGN
ncbi:MAG: hypothetical protein K2N12_06575 [Helicobacter sp.]|nr:hypothetical protein [Helicobacter sp.]